MILQFVGGTGLSSAAIKWFDHGPFSHVDAVLGDGRLLGARSDAIGGMPPGVQMRPPAYEQWELVRRVTLPSSATQETGFLNFLMAQIGKPYDETAIAAFAADRDWRAQDSWFCSELQAAALEAAAWFPWPLFNPVNKIAPTDLILAVSARTPVGG